MKSPTETKAFSLVELSIVLVILGLLVGGILSGKHLIHAAEINAQIRDFGQMQQAITSFRDKYFGLPGDITNATSFWGTASNCAATSNTYDGPTTCNGNGNGKIDFYAVETTRAWQQLGNAGLIPGKYTGAQWGVAPIIGIHLPPGKLPHSYYALYDGQGFFGGAMNVLALSVGNTPIDSQDIWTIDKKMDDGKPYKGRIQIDPESMIFDVVDGSCTGIGDENMDYDLTADACYYPPILTLAQ